MESNWRVLTLLFLAAVASGCVHSGGSETLTEGPESVVIQSLEVTPPQIYSGQSVRASITAANAGQIPADVILGDNGGDRILTDYCPDIFSNAEDQYSAASSRITENQNSYSLEPGEKINVRWLLRQEGDVPLYGQRCGLDFSVPFNYSVQAYRQVQIKQDRDVEGSPGLTSESSSGPMVLAIETLPGATGLRNTYIASDTGDDRINVLVQMINREPQEEYRKGLVDVYKKSFHIEASEPLQLNESFEDGEWVAEGYEDPKCDMPEGQISMFQGRSVTIRCSLPIDSSEIESPSVLSEISAGVDYKYIKDAGTRTVRVETRG